MANRGLHRIAQAVIELLRICLCSTQRRLFCCVVAYNKVDLTNAECVVVWAPLRALPTIHGLQHLVVVYYKIVLDVVSSQQRTRN